MSYTQITTSDLTNKGVKGLADTPGLSTDDMQAKFDEIALDVIVPKFNNLCEELDTADASGNVKSDDVRQIKLDANNEIQVYKNNTWSTPNNASNVISDDVRKIKVNSSNQLQTYNGSTWNTPLSGHQIRQSDNTVTEQRPTIRFMDTGVTVVDNPTNNETQVFGCVGAKGEKGDKGDTGDSGFVTTIANGFYGLEVDSSGNLYVDYNDSTGVPTFTYDSDTGNLYVEVG